MFPPGRFLAAVTLAVVASATAATPASAGWVTFKNDSNREVVVQETVVGKDGVVRRGVPRRLLPGETLREFQAVPGEKRIDVYDRLVPTKPLYSGKLTLKADNQTFSIATDGKAATVVPVVLKEAVSAVPLNRPTVTPPPAPTPKK